MISGAYLSTQRPAHCGVPLTITIASVQNMMCQLKTFDGDDRSSHNEDRTVNHNVLI